MDVLFITSNRLGDAVLTTGLLAHLLDRFPDARLTIACGPLPAPLFRAVPRLREVIALPKRSWGRHWLRLWRHCAGRRWDMVVDLRDTPVSRLLRARERAVYHPARRGEHKVVELGRLLGLHPPPAPRLWIDEATRSAAERLTGTGRLLAMAPAANWCGKEWPADRFAELADRLTGPGGVLDGARVLVLAGPGEEGRCRPVLDRLGTARSVDLVGRTDPLLAGACLARARLFIGNDSGLMHMAAAANTPTLGLFGPTPAEIYGPWGRHAAYVRATRPDGGTPEDWMRALELPEVERAAHELLARTEPVPA